MSVSPEDFLGKCSYVDWDEPNVREQARALASVAADQHGLIKNTFEFVRDEVEHSWDQFLSNGEESDIEVTAKASDVLAHKTGYCYAKSHLLAALLRANDIPTALCYQRIILDDKPTYCLHGLNAVYLDDYGWYRIDPRGNTEHISSEFSPPVENLALELFGLGEFHIDDLFAEPKACVIQLLESAASVEEVFERLSETDELAC